jgi:pyrimidine-specific ribonucleoside hydrolase
MRRILGTLIALLLLQPVLPHYKARYHVIVDTDGGPDDIRAICMMLASPEIEVIAFTAVDGFLPPDQTAGRIKELLTTFGHEGIPVGIDAGRLMPEALELEEMPVDIIALGPLTNLSQLLEREPGTPSLVRKIYWYNDASDNEDFNYSHDPRSARIVLKSTLSMDRVCTGGNLISLQDYFPACLDTLTSRYAAAVKALYMEPPHVMRDLLTVSNMGADCIPLYLLYPEHYQVDVAGEEPICRKVNPINTNGMVPLLLKVLDSDREDKSIIFSSFPTDPGMFEEDVAPITREIIERHGLKEWKIVVLTNEFHEHLGIYSILGAKMGLRAREYFNVGIDELKIESFAGSQPPVSCLNDGLQVSTGGTLGHGTITLGEGEVFPKARFSFKNRIIELNIREDIRQQIKKDVGYGVKTYGLESTEYWDYIRELALRYWLELSRFEIFEIRDIAPLN